MSSYGPSRSSLPLATQLSATPPARTRCGSLVFCMKVAADPHHDFFGDRLDARRQVHVLLLEHRLRCAGRAAEQVVEPAIGHRQPLAVVEVLHVEPEAAVGLQVEELLQDQVVIDRPAIGGQAHQLVFAAVYLEATIIRECRIEQAQRVRET